MVHYLGDANAVTDDDDIRGIYLGRGRLWLETSTTTSAFANKALQAMNSMVKVPAREFTSLIRHGVDRFSVAGGKLEGSCQDFRAALPASPAEHYVADISVIDHVPLTAAIATSVIQLMGIALRFTDPGASNTAYRFVYVVESRIFATDGYSMFAAALPGSLAEKLVFSRSSAEALVRLWGKQVPTHAMHSERSLLLKNAQCVSAIRCVDTVVPTALYRVARKLPREHICSLSRQELIDALTCMAISHPEENEVHLILRDSTCRIACADSISEIPAYYFQNVLSIGFKANMAQLHRAVETFDSDTVSIARYAGLNDAVSITDIDRRATLVIRCTEDS